MQADAGVAAGDKDVALAAHLEFISGVARLAHQIGEQGSNDRAQRKDLQGQNGPRLDVHLHEGPTDSETVSGAALGVIYPIAESKMARI